MKTYNKAVGVPEHVKAVRPRGTVTLHYSHHASTRARLDRYGFIAWLPVTLRLDRCEAVEYTVDEHDQVVKVVYRTGYAPRMNLMLCLAVVFINKEGERLESPLVTTVWLNERVDRHATLDRSRVAQ